MGVANRSNGVNLRILVAPKMSIVLNDHIVCLAKVFMFFAVNVYCGKRDNRANRG